MDQIDLIKKELKKFTWNISIIYIHDKKADPAEIFWKYFKTIIQLELHNKQTWLRNEKLLSILGKTEIFWLI